MNSWGLHVIIVSHICKEMASIMCLMRISLYVMNTNISTCVFNRQGQVSLVLRLPCNTFLKLSFQDNGHPQGKYVCAHVRDHKLIIILRCSSSTVDFHGSWTWIDYSIQSPVAQSTTYHINFICGIPTFMHSNIIINLIALLFSDFVREKRNFLLQLISVLEVSILSRYCIHAHKYNRLIGLLIPGLSIGNISYLLVKHWHNIPSSVSCISQCHLLRRFFLKFNSYAYIFASYLCTF